MNKRSVLQDWVQDLTFMQQSVLISAIRGPDGVRKTHPSKMLCRWLRRCILFSAFEKKILITPYEKGGGSYTGPSIELVDDNWEFLMDVKVKEYLDSIDDLPHHFHLHILHAIEILGYKHSDKRIRDWWLKTYQRFVKDMHLKSETEKDLDNRLNDCELTWKNDNTRVKNI